MFLKARPLRILNCVAHVARLRPLSSTVSTVTFGNSSLPSRPCAGCATEWMSARMAAAISLVAYASTSVATCGISSGGPESLPCTVLSETTSRSCEVLRCRKPSPAPLPLTLRRICSSVSSSAWLGDCPPLETRVSRCGAGNARSSSGREPDAVPSPVGEIRPMDELPEPLGSFSTEAVASTT